MDNNIRQDVENLINQGRWDEALSLLDLQPHNADLADLRAKIEKHNRETQSYIEKYIREHLGRYTEASIFDKLINAGYSESDIRDAFERLKPGSRRAISSAGKSENQDVSANPLGFFLFFPVIPFIVYVALMFNYRLWEYIIFIYIAVFLLGTFLPRMIKENNPSMAKGMINGFRTTLVIFLVLPVVAVVALFGICMLMGVKL